MKFRRLVFALLLFLLGSAMAFSPWGTELLGRWRAEPVYQDRCASSWRQEALRWEIALSSNYNGHVSRVRCRSSPTLLGWLPWGTGQTHLEWHGKLALLSGEPEAAPVLLVLLRDHDPRVRLIAAEGLGRIGKPARTAIPALVETLEDEDLEVSNEAEDALFRIDWDRAKAAGLGWGRWWR
jgi:hypothetical protein